MNINMGERIRTLRLSKSMTQEQLGQRLGVTAQAISKWESGVNMPDIQMLPDLSIIFGVSIDELFAMDDRDRMERIENRIQNTSFLSAEEYTQTECFLRDGCKKERLKPRATLLLAMLYNKRAEEYHRLAAPLAREALLLSPGTKAAHNAVFDAERGAYQDWNRINHRELIDFYQEVADRHPDDIRNYFWLLNLLIADCRTGEAREYAEKMKSVEHSYHYELYMGRICQAECNLPDALNWWQKMVEHQPNSWITWAEYASSMAKLGRYEEALEYYKKAMSMRKAPRFIDCEEAAAQICLIRGDKKGAVAFLKQKLKIVREDWTTEGELVNNILREIRRIESMNTD